jgi:hypothetical protein
MSEIYFVINVWRKSVFDIYFTEFGTALTTILLILVVSLNPAYGKVYLIQHYVIKFVSDLRQVGGFLWELRFPPPIKLTATCCDQIL